MKKIVTFLIACILSFESIAYATWDDSYYVLKQGNWSNYSWFAEGLCAVLDSDSQRWGFIDKSGNFVIQPKFKNANFFNDGLCNVTTVDNEYVFINRNGDVVHEAKDSGDKYIKLLNGCGYITAWNYYDGFLIDANYNDITKAKPLTDHTYSFFRTPDKKIYNSKGIDITNKLDIQDFVSDANDKYIAYSNESKITVHNIDGEVVSSFSHNSTKYVSKITLFSEAIRISNDENLYNIDGSVILSTPHDIEEYYGKYYVISKRNGTSALFKKDGQMLVDFGKWDTIVPSSISEQMLVSVNDKYGISDFNNNLIVPPAGVHAEVINNGKTAILDTDYPNQRTLYDFYSTNSRAITDSIALGIEIIQGGRIVAQPVDAGYDWTIFDERLNAIISAKTPLNIYGEKEGIFLFDAPGDWNEPNEYIIFNDGGGIKVELNRTPIPFDIPPVVQSERTLVPMRAIFEALGATVEWNNESQTITATNKDITIRMQIGNNTILKNGQSSQIDVSPQIIEGRTMVPIRAISDCFDVLVDWNGYTQTVSLFTN